MILLGSLALVAGAAAPMSPELPVATYVDRRERLLRSLGSCAAMLSAQPAADGEHDRTDADFFWLTGISDEPGASIVLLPKAKHRRTILFLKPRDPEAERWTGPREAISPSLKAKYGVDAVYRGDGGRVLLEAATSGHDCLELVAPLSDLKDERNDASATRQAAAAAGLKLVYARDALSKLRVAHSPEELTRLERAIGITRFGHEAAARAVVAGAIERNVQAEIEHAFFGGGATGLSYGSIVGSGENGAILHWMKNSRTLKPEDLVVIDAAAEYGHYASDVTRTYPVSGHFSPDQARVYRAVYQTQEDILAAIKPGVSMSDLQAVAEDSLKRQGYLDKFIHGFGHYVGLEVHDVGASDAPIPDGAVFTVEPGIYLPEHGFGVRIEDEVLMLPNGKWRLLTDGFPRKLEDVEAWIARARSPVGHPNEK